MKIRWKKKEPRKEYKRVLSDQQLWELLHGRQYRKEEQQELLFSNLRKATKGVDSANLIELHVVIIDPRDV